MMMSSIGLPTLNGFIGELLILQGAFIANIWWAVVAASSLVLGAAYMLWLYQRTMFGKVENPKNEKLPDLNLREIATFVPLIILAVWIGIYPKPFLDRLAPTVNAVVARVNPAYPAVALRASDCDENKPLNPFATTAPCGDADAPGASRPRPDPCRRLRPPSRPRGRAPLMPAWFSLNDLYYILPELVLAGGVLVVLIATALTARPRQAWLSWLGIGVLAASAIAMIAVTPAAPVSVARGLLSVDAFSTFFKAIFLLAAAFTLLLSLRYLDTEGARHGEYVFLVLCATLGMMFMATGTDLITIFVGLETMAIAFYILAGLLKPDRRSNEAGVKYFLLGTFSLGILLYGISILYGMSGTTNLRALAIAVAGHGRDPWLLLALILVVAGIGFKIAAVPFHMWAPDVYEGAPTPITAFLSVGSKAASFAMLLRIFLEGLPSLSATGRSSSTCSRS